MRVFSRYEELDPAGLVLRTIVFHLHVLMDDKIPHLFYECTECEHGGIPSFNAALESEIPPEIIDAMNTHVQMRH